MVSDHHPNFVNGTKFDRNLFWELFLSWHVVLCELIFHTQIFWRLKSCHFLLSKLTEDIDGHDAPQQDPESEVVVDELEEGGVTLDCKLLAEFAGNISSLQLRCGT